MNAAHATIPAATHADTTAPSRFRIQVPLSRRRRDVCVGISGERILPLRAFGDNVFASEPIKKAQDALELKLPICALRVYNPAQLQPEPKVKFDDTKRGAMAKRRFVAQLFVVIAAALVSLSAARNSIQAAPAAQQKPQPPRSVRLYVFDCGVLHNSDMGRFNLTKED